MHHDHAPPAWPIHRRALLLAGASMAGAGWAAPRLPPIDPLLGPGADYGWVGLDLGQPRRFGVNLRGRFPMCSSFKWLLAAAVLARVDRGQESLDRRVTLLPITLLPASPVVEKARATAHGGEGSLTVGELCAAATVFSDNSAANILLPIVGGPAGLTAWLRAHGDAVTRLDRTELALNDVPVGDPRDTTTCLATLGNLQRILYGEVLTRASRDKLYGWMLACRTAPGRFTAALPEGWRLAHRTGTREYDPAQPRVRAASAELGVLLPPKGAPILLAAFTAGSTRAQEEVDRWFARTAREVIARVQARRG